MKEQLSTPEPQEQRGENEYFVMEDFEGLENIKILPYSGEGATSYSRNMEDKKRYLTTELGIDISKYEKDKSMIGTLFIVAAEIVVTEYFRRDGEKFYGSTESEEFKEWFKGVLDGKNCKLTETRVDRFEYRRELPTEPGVRDEDIRRELGFSANPTNRVSSEELRELVQHALSELKKE
jgi:hypothetical protein